MTKRRKLYNRESGLGRADEDWWDLVYDEAAGELFVEHSWSHLGGRGNGSERFEINEFLKSDRYGVLTLKSALLAMFPV